jgi:hypothetical protein
MEKIKTPFIPGWIFEQGFTARHIAVLCYVARRGLCYASQATIGKCLHIERHDVGKILRELVAHQWLVLAPNGANKRATKCYKLADQLGIRFDAPKRKTWGQMAPQSNHINSYSTAIGEQPMQTEPHKAENIANAKENASFQGKKVSEHSAAAVRAAINAQNATKEAVEAECSMNTAEAVEATVTEDSEGIQGKDNVLSLIFGGMEHLRGRRPANRKAEKWA